jgi:FAD:protein FMN transferase
MAVFSYAEKDGHSFTIIEEGKHGPITFIITIAADGTINNIEVLESKEIKGAKINKKRFLKQFVGKSSKDPLKLGKDIDAVAGATVSSNAAVRAARKALVLWGELFSEKDNSKR